MSYFPLWAAIIYIFWKDREFVEDVRSLTAILIKRIESYLGTEKSVNEVGFSDCKNRQPKSILQVSFSSPFAHGVAIAMPPETQHKDV